MKRRISEDPELRNEVKRRAMQGTALLESLKPPPPPPRNRRGTGRFDSLEDDTVSMIARMCVLDVLKTHDAKLAANRFCALRLVSRAFNKVMGATATSILVDASAALNAFATTGCIAPTTSVLGTTPCDLPWKTYKRFACSPALLMSLPSNDKALYTYIVRRLSCNVDCNVSAARAHARGALSPPPHADGLEDPEDRENCVGLKHSHSFEFRTANLRSSRVMQLFHIANASNASELVLD